MNPCLDAVDPRLIDLAETFKDPIFEQQNPFGQRLTPFMISKRIVSSCVPMSLLADHPNVQFNFYRPGKTAEAR